MKILNVKPSDVSRMDSDCMLYFATNSECIFIRDFIENNDLMVVLTTIQKACSSKFVAVIRQNLLYLTTIQNACSSKKKNAKFNSLYLLTIQNACSSLDKYHSV